MTYDTTGLKNLHMGLSFLQNSIHIFSEKLINIFNECLINGKFPDTLQRAVVTLIFKKENDHGKGNYHPVSMLSSFSKCLKNYDLSKSMIICILLLFAKSHST